MKTSRSDVRCQSRAIPELRFEDQSLTSCAGLVIFQDLFATLELKTRLRACFRHVRIGAIYNRSTVFLQLIVHILLGYRQLQDSRYYSDDPSVQRLLGLKRLPSVSTLSRMLKDATEASVKKVLDSHKFLSGWWAVRNRSCFSVAPC